MNSQHQVMVWFFYLVETAVRLLTLSKGADINVRHRELRVSKCIYCVGVWVELVNLIVHKVPIRLS